MQQVFYFLLFNVKLLFVFAVFINLLYFTNFSGRVVIARNEAICSKGMSVSAPLSFGEGLGLRSAIQEPLIVSAGPH
jgi:hypothetical protein